MNNKLKNLCYILIVIGIILFLAGIYFACIKAGLPYQDPTLEMTKKWLFYYHLGKNFSTFGVIAVMLGIIGRITTFVKKKM